MNDLRKHSGTSNILRVFLTHSTTGQGLTGLTHASSGLKIASILDNEAACVLYSQAASTIETITTLGTFETPTASKCRFKEVDATNHPGLYEVHIADARCSAANAKRLEITFSGATNLRHYHHVIEFTGIDGAPPTKEQIPTTAAIAAALPTVTQNADALLDRTLSAGTDSGGRTVRNALRFLVNKWYITAGTLAVTKEDDSTIAWTATVTTSGGVVTGVDPA